MSLTLVKEEQCKGVIFNIWEEDKGNVIITISRKEGTDPRKIKILVDYATIEVLSFSGKKHNSIISPPSMVLADEKVDSIRVSECPFAKQYKPLEDKNKDEDIEGKVYKDLCQISELLKVKPPAIKGKSLKKSDVEYWWRHTLDTVEREWLDIILEFESPHWPISWMKDELLQYIKK